MAKNPYSVLGVSQSATQSEISDAYRRKKDELQELRFAEGETGAQACRDLTDLEDAYQQAIDRATTNYDIGDETALYSEVEDLIKTNQLDAAQAKLNSLPNYTAEWHYYQSVLYYRKSWHIDAKKQLELALTLDPGNQKYQESLNEMTRILSGGQNPNAQQKANTNQGQNNYYRNQQNPNGRSYQGQNDPNYQQQGMGCGPCECCQGLICADCCCECCGGDLISCC